MPTTPPDSPNADDAAPRESAFRVWVDRLVKREPHLPYTAPFFSFLLLMLPATFTGPEALPWLYALRTFGALGVALIFWRYWPPLGRLHLPSAVIFGLLTTVMWIVVHQWFAAQDWYEKTQILGKDAAGEDLYNCFDRLGTGVALWLFLIVRIGGASIVVPIVEEIFWRGFVLRILIEYWEFEKIPLATYTLRSFVICSLLSALEHPMWEVGILCWMVWNLLFYWKKSLLFMIVMHGVTNFALYVYVVIARDWVFWS